MEEKRANPSLEIGMITYPEFQSRLRRSIAEAGAEDSDSYSSQDLRRGSSREVLRRHGPYELLRQGDWRGLGVAQAHYLAPEQLTQALMTELDADDD